MRKKKSCIKLAEKEKIKNSLIRRKKKTLYRKEKKGKKV